MEAESKLEGVVQKSRSASERTLEELAAELSEEVQHERLSTFSMLQILRRHYSEASEDEITRAALFASKTQEGAVKWKR